MQDSLKRHIIIKAIEDMKSKSKRIKQTLRELTNQTQVVECLTLSPTVLEGKPFGGKGAEDSAILDSLAFLEITFSLLL